jgi:hypothetical protein
LITSSRRLSAGSPVARSERRRTPELMVETSRAVSRPTSAKEALPSSLASHPTTAWPRTPGGSGWALAAHRAPGRTLCKPLKLSPSMQAALSARSSASVPMPGNVRLPAHAGPRRPNETPPGDPHRCRLWRRPDNGAAQCRVGHRTGRAPSQCSATVLAPYPGRRDVPTTGRPAGPQPPRHAPDSDECSSPASSR